VQRKKQRNTLQKAIAPQLFAGYTLLTYYTIKLVCAGFYARPEGFGQLLCYYHHWSAACSSQNIKKAPLCAQHQTAFG
jgi:hypothetical protein